MITAVILAHNDEETIGRTLASVAWCDEVIVVDDESTDDTVGIAKKHKAQVVRGKLNDDFAAQRNFALQKAKGDWVFFVDSDEVVSKELAEEIQEKINELRITNDGLRGFYIKRRDSMWDRELKHGETGNIKLIRLGRKNAGKWVRPVHEVWNIQGEVGELKNSLQHYPHPNVAQFLSEINRYSTLRAAELFDAGVRVSWWQILAYPKAKFFLNYFWRLGFLDGTAGAVHALLMSFHSFLVRGKLWQLHNKVTN